MYIYKQICIYIYIYTAVADQTSLHELNTAGTCWFAYAYTYICICIYIYMYVYIDMDL